MKKIITTLIFIMSMIFIGTNNANAASSVDFYAECNYKYTLNADQSSTGDNITLYYSGMKDSDGDELGLVAYGTDYGNAGEYSYANEGYLTFGTEDYSRTWYKFSNGETSSPLSSFKSNYTATGECPKYLYAEFTSDSWGTKYYKMMFSNTKPDICAAGDAKCKILGESSGTVKKVTYYEEEDFWEDTFSGDNTCDKLHVKLYIAGKQFKANYDNALGSSYTSLAVTGETVKNVDFQDIVNIATGKDPSIYVNPNEGGTWQEQGVSLGTPLGSDYCHLSSGMPTTAKSCAVYDSVKATVISKQDAATNSSKTIDDMATKYLNYNRGSDTYSSKSYSNEKDADALLKMGQEINKALKDSNFSTISDSYIVYLQGLIDGKTLCSKDTEQISTILNAYSDFAKKKSEKVAALNDTLTKINARLTAMGETDKAAKINEYIANAEKVAADIDAVSAKAKASYLAGEKFGIKTYDASKPCGVISDELRNFLQTIIDYIRIAGIVLAVVLGILDYIKVIFGSDEKSMAKANKNFSTRLIAVALLFLIPAILTFVLGLFNILGTGSAGTCGIQ